VNNVFKEDTTLNIITDLLLILREKRCILLKYAHPNSFKMFWQIKYWNFLFFSAICFLFGHKFASKHDVNDYS